MGRDAKYGKITTQFGDIPDDEPVFLFRGRDLTTPRVIAYGRRCAKDLGSPAEHLRVMLDSQHYIEGWQRFNEDRTKVPTSETYRRRLAMGVSTEDDK